MGRNFLVLAGTLALFSVVCLVMSFSAGSHSKLPGDQSMWQSLALVLFVAALASAVIGVLTTMFTQVQRRDQERQDKEGRYRH